MSGLRTESILHVNRRSGALEDSKSPDNWRRHAILRLIDLEVLERSLRLRAPVLVRRDEDLSKGIGLCSRLGHSVG